MRRMDGWNGGEYTQDSETDGSDKSEDISCRCNRVIAY